MSRTPEDNPFKQPPRGAKAAAAPSAALGAGEAAALASKADASTAADYLRVALGATTETEQVAADTLAELERQGEQIERTHRKVDQIEAYSDKSSHILKGMSSIFGSIKQKFTKAPPSQQDVVARRAAERAARRADMATSASAADEEREKRRAAAAAVAATFPSGGAGASKPAKQTTATTGKSAAELEEEALLRMISSSVSNIKESAVEMGHELDRQDVALDELTSAVDRVGIKVIGNTKEARRIAR